VVSCTDEGEIIGFLEKRSFGKGIINGGVYVLNRPGFLALELPERFSFEKDFLEKMTGKGTLYGVVQDGYFIDIGIPEDFQKAQADLQRPVLDLTKVDASWSLFLDRDGVINEEKLGEYVLDWSEFIFSTGVLTVFKLLSQKFGKLFIVTNQRGVGKGLMKEETLQSIHLEMQREVEIVQGKIDQIYYCTSMDNKDFYRKPNPGMALLAKEHYPEIDLSKSIMVGNKPSDMQFGRAAGMFTVFIASTNPEQPFPHPDIDLYFHSLEGFARSL
ncbi:MAG TPA: HAD-IIIA family hydrolase, partial [Flavisolibacter sp.]|nr:HAD-IIIA family hydrolase [Flavisolibacter sp.]